MGKTIASLKVEDDQLIINFDDGTGVAFVDQGQSCCEARYMTCDDDLPYFVGAKLVNAEVAAADSLSNDDDYGEHEVEFLIIHTDKGNFTIANHNEHNGWYGGFSIGVVEIKQ